MKRTLALAMVFALLAGCRAQPDTPEVSVGAPKDPVITARCGILSAFMTPPAAMSS